jgi:hypothetical protein
VFLSIHFCAHAHCIDSKGFACNHPRNRVLALEAQTAASNFARACMSIHLLKTGAKMSPGNPKTTIASTSFAAKTLELC